MSTRWASTLEVSSLQPREKKRCYGVKRSDHGQLKALLCKLNCSSVLALGGFLGILGQNKPWWPIPIPQHHVLIPLGRKQMETLGLKAPSSP